MAKHRQAVYIRTSQGKVKIGDSAITLSWLQGKPCRWTTFVANRVAQVREITDVNMQWGYFDCKENPADLIFRRMGTNQLWWEWYVIVMMKVKMNYYHHTTICKFVL